MKEDRILIFAGTTEGRRLAEYLAAQKIQVHVCVATEYGESLLPQADHITISHDRMNAEEMKCFIREYAPSLVVDATHPYAKEVTENIRQACAHTQVHYERLVRESEQQAEGCVYVDSVKAAVEYLRGTQGNVLVTTGSKELEAFAALEDYRERIYARVLSTADVAVKCEKLGLSGRHLICMQGPFSTEMNVALLHEFEIDYMVTKESGAAGGFRQKCEAAKLAGVRLVIVGRPQEEEGHTYGEMIRMLSGRFGFVHQPEVTVAGIGMGGADGFTREVRKACDHAELLIGAGRMLEASAGKGQAVYQAYQPEDIVAYIKEHPEYGNVVVVLSGDPGFYSGAKKLLALLEKELMIKARVLPGISSPAYFCAKLGISWDDAKLVSVHGRKQNIPAAVRRHKKVLALTGSSEDIRMICRKLTDAGYGKLTMHIGENLSYENEQIIHGKVEEFCSYEGEKLSLICIENPQGGTEPVTHGIPDAAFVRGDVPMTKEEVRSISISRLGLRRDSVVYDIGAGTGSVSVEAALQAEEGHVYAVEINEEAVSLIEENCRRFGVDNLTVIHEKAPDGLEMLPEPDCVFIGGSKGNLAEILNVIIKKNPHVRVVINAITLETLSQAIEYCRSIQISEEEIVQVNIAKSRQLGGYHMMTGQNPVYVISFTCNEEGKK